MRFLDTIATRYYGSLISRGLGGCRSACRRSVARGVIVPPLPCLISHICDPSWNTPRGPSDVARTGCALARPRMRYASLGSSRATAGFHLPGVDILRTTNDHVKHVVKARRLAPPQIRSLQYQQREPIAALASSDGSVTAAVSDCSYITLRLSTRRHLLRQPEGVKHGPDARGQL